MSNDRSVQDKRSGPGWRLTRDLGAASVICVGMVLLYGYAPEPVDLHLPSIIPLCIGFLVIYLVITGALLRRIRDRRHLTFAGMLLLIVLVVFFVLSFSWLYRVLESVDPASFSEPFTDVSAIYFTIAVLSTVGFGDIRPLDDLSRALVTIQMVLGVGLLAASISMVSRKTDRVIKELAEDPTSESPSADGHDPAGRPKPELSSEQQQRD
ncbi:potassium channel family protein [Candidatus Nanopelagicales bacterium]|nr:potassium channel family protein [Candidatus Nanopelagicales bacterium]